MIEVERKFLVRSKKYREEATKVRTISQGFLNTDMERTVRVRLCDDIGYLTVKGISSKDGTTRFEWETIISGKEAKALLELCEGSLIEKLRYEINVNDHMFEVDEFLNDNYGLVIAEIELEDKNEFFDKPDWLGEEVTGDKKYYNSLLSKVPYSQW